MVTLSAKVCLAVVLCLGSHGSFTLARGFQGGFAVVASTGGLCVSPLIPDRLVAVRDSIGRAPNFLKNVQPFTRVSRRARAIRQLYFAICSLRPVPTSTHGKPSVVPCNSYGVEIRLVFWHGLHRLLRVTQDTGNCLLLFRAPHALRGGPAHATGHIPFWVLVARALGTHQADILPGRR